jgi:cytochrome c oxidase cbb3-type subunit 4
MHLDYETVVHFTKSWGLIYFIVLMAIVLVYAFWPGSKKKFDRAARMPLDDDTTDTPAAQGAENHG